MSMDDDDDGGRLEGLAFFSGHAPPALVSLTPFSPSISPFPRRLSSQFSRPSSPVPAARKQLAWISLQGRLVGAEDATSTRTIGGGLSPQEAVAWELFTPIHRVLIVAVVAVAASQSRKNCQILQLQKSVNLRDHVLSNMQQKLDDLCEQLNNKEQIEAGNHAPFMKREENCCWLCHQHRILSHDYGVDFAAKASSGPLTNVAEQEERRMSDLSDWASSSITSSTDIQLNASGIEHDILKLKRECEEKEATIKKLSTFLHSSDGAGSKRIAELEDIIRRKNQIITKLKKDMVVLEQKVAHLARLRRPSFSASNSDTGKLPFMADNVIYDMDSLTSASSSDSDCSLKSRPQKQVAEIQEIPVQDSEFSSRRNHKSAPQTPAAKIEEIEPGNTEPPLTSKQKLIPAKASNSAKSFHQHTVSCSTSPLKEKSMNQRFECVSSLKPRQLSDSCGLKTRKRTVGKSKVLVPYKKWI